jgi:small ligand-binding sensory domain FIST
MDRALAVGNAAAAVARANEGLRYSAQRLRIRAGDPGADSDEEAVVLSSVRAYFTDEADIMSALDRFLAARTRVQASSEGAAAGLDELREALAMWIDTVAEVVEKAAPQPVFNASLLDDSGGSVAAMLRGGA